jgi:hypothetical protein
MSRESYDRVDPIAAGWLPAVAAAVVLGGVAAIWQVGGLLTLAAEQGVVSAELVVAGRPEPGGVVALIEPDGGVRVVACRLSVPRTVVGAAADPPR